MHVHVNAAVSADGKLSTRRREQLVISGSTDFERVEELRGAVDAVLVGVGTVLADDPSLTAETGTPRRVVLDSSGRTPPDAAVLEGTAETIICLAEAASAETRADLAAAGASLVTAGTDQVDPRRALGALQADHDVESILVEGGGEVIFSLFEAGLVDELTTYVGPLVVGGRDAPTLVDGVGFVDEFPRLELKSLERIDEGALLHWEVPA